MRRLAPCLVALLTLAFASPAAADDDFEWPGPLNSFMIGLNGIITAPADPFASAIWPSEGLADLPVSAVTGRFAGFFGGTLLSVWRVTSGVVEMVLAPLPSERVTPEPRFEVINALDY